MKSSKESSLLVKEVKPKKTGKPKKINSEQYIPRHEEIMEKANELYLQRVERGESGTAENDWLEAEKLLANSND
jgi:hypothetical protein